MNAENASREIRAGSLGTAHETPLFPTIAMRHHRQQAVPIPFDGKLDQTGRDLTEQDWKFPNAIPNQGDKSGDDTNQEDPSDDDIMRGWLIYEYARESPTLRAWAEIFIKAARPKAPSKLKMRSSTLRKRLESSFNSGRDGWIPGLLVSLSKYLSEDRPWEAIDEAARSQAVHGAISSFGAMHVLGGNHGDVRKRELGVRLTHRGDQRRPAWSREDQFESQLKTKQRRGNLTEVFQIEIDWNGTRNDELSAAFAELLKILRPINSPELRQKTRSEKSGIKRMSMCTALNYLGVTRLCHVHRPKEVLSKLRMDDNQRSRMRDGASKHFRSLFPFLPPSETMRSAPLLLSRLRHFVGKTSPQGSAI